METWSGTLVESTFSFLQEYDGDISDMRYGSIRRYFSLTLCDTDSLTSAFEFVNSHQTTPSKPEIDSAVASAIRIERFSLLERNLAFLAWRCPTFCEEGIALYEILTSRLSTAFTFLTGHFFHRPSPYPSLEFFALDCMGFGPSLNDWVERPALKRLNVRLLFKFTLGMVG